MKGNQSQIPLPKRHVSHILESESRRVIRNLLPDEWIITDVVSDYGCDMRAEVWIDGRPIGRTVSIQLKSAANRKRDDHGIIRVDIKPSTINYLQQFHPSYIVALSKGDSASLALLRVKELSEIILPLLCNSQTSQKKVIPIVRCRESYDYGWYQVWSGVVSFWRIVVGMGTLAVVRKWPNQPRYYSDIDNEEEFWLRETYANLGYYVGLYRPSLRIPTVSFLLNNFQEKRHNRAVGIMEGLFHLRHSSPEMVETAIKWIREGTGEQALVAAHYVGHPSNINFLDRIMDSSFNGMIPDGALNCNDLNAFRRSMIRSIGRIGSSSVIAFLLETLREVWPYEISAIFATADALSYASTTSTSACRQIRDGLRKHYPHYEPFDNLPYVLEKIAEDYYRNNR